MEIRGREHIDPKGQYIYISNHRSYLDSVIAGAVLPGYVKFLGKAEMLRWPVLGYLLSKFYVSVKREDKEQRTRSMAEMEEKIKTGCSFFICPEGTCNDTQDFFIRFYNGAFKLSGETGIPLVPLTFVGSGDIMPRKTLLLIRPGKLVVYWHAPIPASEFPPGNVEPGKEKVMEIMRKDLLKHYPSGRYNA
jgi:1-acyl-sn-glycerol-3-phosphate acyltransferase